MASKQKRNKRSNPAATNEYCALCCKEIIRGKEVALFCEGQGSWMHCNCVGVSVKVQCPEGVGNNEIYPSLYYVISTINKAMQNLENRLNVKRKFKEGISAS